MNRAVLKWIAIITMTIDHIGVYWVDPGLFHDVLRGIGRISFVLFAFLVAEGFRHSRNVFKYAFRLSAYALVVEGAILGYSLYSGVNLVFTFNVFWPLAMGLWLLIALTREHPAWRLLCIPILLFTVFVQYPYHWYGLALILLFGLLDRKKTVILVAATLLIHLIFVDTPWSIAPLSIYPPLQQFGMLALPLILLYNGVKGKDSKWFFYLYYPAHLAVIYAIGQFFR
jgi:hypothetical protein